ncbi:MAG: hypothetical protein MZV70_52740 [Desulfobacterales bacterium]|nr:hypothetical protein [Desulfobacterales bacterium]
MSDLPEDLVPGRIIAKDSGQGQPDGAARPGALFSRIQVAPLRPRDDRSLSGAVWIRIAVKIRMRRSRMSNGRMRLTGLVGAGLVLALGATAAAGADFVIGGTRVKAAKRGLGIALRPGPVRRRDRDPLYRRQRGEERPGPGPGGGRPCL